MEALKIYPELQNWKNGKKVNDGLCYITIRFDLNNNRVANQRLNIQVNVNDWDSKKLRVKQSDTSFSYINLIIERKLAFNKLFFLKRGAFGQPITKELIIKFVQNGSLDNFLDYAEHVIANKTLKDGLPYSEDSKRRYRDEVRRLKEFMPSIMFKDITLRFLEDYKVWLFTVYRKKDGKKYAIIPLLKH